MKEQGLSNQEKASLCLEELNTDIYVLNGFIDGSESIITCKTIGDNHIVGLKNHNIIDIHYYDFYDSYFKVFGNKLYVVYYREHGDESILSCRTYKIELNNVVIEEFDLDEVNK